VSKHGFEMCLLFYASITVSSTVSLCSECASCARLEVDSAIITIFFASGQTYVALSRVRKHEDLTLWDFSPNAIIIAHSCWNGVTLLIKLD